MVDAAKKSQDCFGRVALFPLFPISLSLFISLFVGEGVRMFVRFKCFSLPCAHFAKIYFGPWRVSSHLLYNHKTF